MEEGSASTTFNSPGNHEYLIGDVVNSWHHVYNQTLQHPGVSPEKQKYEFGEFGYEAGKELNSGYYREGCPQVKGGLVPALEEARQEFPRYSTLENAQYYWFVNELAAYLANDNPMTMSSGARAMRNQMVTVKRGTTAEIVSLANMAGNSKTPIDLLVDIAYNDMRLYQWFKDKGVDNQRAILPPQDSIFALLSLLRKERPDLIPSRYTILAHSMGGLTAREYIQSDFYQGDVDKLITFDTPHLGSGSAAPPGISSIMTTSTRNPLGLH